LPSKFQVLGCPNCKKVEEITRKAASNLSIQTQFEKVTDMVEITT